MKKIADQLDIKEDSVRNYFGVTHYKKGERESANIHIEKGKVDGYCMLMMTGFWRWLEA